MAKRSGRERRRVSRRNRDDSATGDFDDEALLKRIKDGQQRTSSGGFKNFLDTEKIGDMEFWRPEKKQHLFDIVPYNAGPNDLHAKEGDPQYVCEAWVHSRVGPKNDRFLCLREHFGEPCPICEDYVNRAEDGEDTKKLSGLIPSRRCLYNVHVLDSREDMRKGVQLLEVSYHYLEKQLMALAKEPVRPGSKGIEPTIIFSSPSKRGKSIKVTVGEKSVPIDDTPTKIPDWTGHAFVDRTEPIDRKILRSAVCLDSLFYKPTYDEVRQSYFGAKGDDEDDERAPKSTRQRESKRGSDLTDDFSTLDDIEEELKDMSMRELKKFVRKYKIDVDVDDCSDEVEAVDEILEEVESLFEATDDDSDDEFEDMDIDELIEYAEDELKMDRKQLRKLKRMNDEDDVRQAVREFAEEDSGGDADEGECPYGYAFGIDNDSRDDCAKCPTDVWEACYDAYRNSK